MLGRDLAFRYSIIPHAGPWHESGVQRQSHAFIRGLKALPVFYTSDEETSLPPEMSFLPIDGENISLSMVKLSEDGESPIFRLWNASSSESVAKLTLPSEPRQIHLSNLREENLEKLTPTNTPEIRIAGKSIVTLRIDY